MAMAKRRGSAAKDPRRGPIGDRSGHAAGEEWAHGRPWCIHHVGFDVHGVVVRKGCFHRNERPRHFDRSVGIKSQPSPPSPLGQ